MRKSALRNKKKVAFALYDTHIQPCGRIEYVQKIDLFHPGEWESYSEALWRPTNNLHLKPFSLNCNQQIPIGINRRNIP